MSNFIFSQKLGSLFSNDIHVNYIICSNASEWFKSLWPLVFHVEEGSAVRGLGSLANWGWTAVPPRILKITIWIVNMELVCSTSGNFMALCYYCSQFFIFFVWKVLAHMQKLQNEKRTFCHILKYILRGKCFCWILKKELKIFHHNFNLDFREGKFVEPKKKIF
jgi:hypothetical protein